MVAIVGGYLLFARGQQADQEKADAGVDRATDRVIDQVRPELEKLVVPAPKAAQAPRIIVKGSEPIATGGKGKGGRGGRGGKGGNPQGGKGGEGGDGAKVETNPEIKPEVNLPDITVAPEIILPPLLP